MFFICLEIKCPDKGMRMKDNTSYLQCHFMLMLLVMQKLSNMDSMVLIPFIQFQVPLKRVTSREATMRQLYILPGELTSHIRERL